MTFNVGSWAHCDAVYVSVSSFLQYKCANIAQTGRILWNYLIVIPPISHDFLQSSLFLEYLNVIWSVGVFLSLL
jgi:hypothetical protein